MRNAVYIVGILFCTMVLTACRAAGVDEASRSASWNAESTGMAENESAAESSGDEAASTISLSVEPGSYVVDIARTLVDAGYASTVSEVLEALDQMDPAPYRWWSQIANREERAFAAEGYIAPITYELPPDATLEEALDVLLSGWDEQLTGDIEEQAASQGLTMDQVLTMASIVEYESARDATGAVKPQVAAVVRNRVAQGMALQMDVTIFYLQEALEPYRDPEQYSAYYDTYERSDLPAGPIGSPSLASVEAVLAPANTQDLFFVYDEAGTYYFAEDYETHLSNCETAGIL